MLCSKCHKEIPQGKEMQIEGTIICKECALIIEKENKEKNVARCWNCNRLIHKGELVHKISKNNSKDWTNWLLFNFLENYEQIDQCDDCYQEWRSKVRKGEKRLRVKGKVLFFCLGVFICLAASLLFPERFKKIYDEMPVVVFLFILLFIIISILGPVLGVDRYEFKKKRKK